MNGLGVRPLEKKDITLIADYWLNAEASFLEVIGVDLNKMPKHEQFTAMLHKQLELPINQRQTYAVIWTLDDTPVGHSNVNPFTAGEEGTLHLHLWTTQTRRKGMGTELVKMSLQHYKEVLNLKKMVVEPYALNAAPNKTLAKLGFNFIKSYITTPGSLNFEQEVNRWEFEF